MYAQMKERFFPAGHCGRPCAICLRQCWRQLCHCNRAWTKLHFQAESVPLQHPAKVEAASVIGSYNNIPLKCYNKLAIPGLKYVAFEPLLRPKRFCNLKTSGVYLDNVWVVGFYLSLPYRPSWTCRMHLSFTDRDPTQPNTIFSARCYES